MAGRSRQATFIYIKDHICKTINSWSSKCLSKVGQEVMIKYVSQVIPSYVMSVFMLPKTLMDDIEKWWMDSCGGNIGASNKGVWWRSWEKLSVHKRFGGMGFKDLVFFDAAMFGKQASKLKTNDDSLVSLLFRARHFPRYDYLEATIGSNPNSIFF